MTNINNDTRSSFFPNSKSARAKEVAKKQYSKTQEQQRNSIPMEKNNRLPVSVEIGEEVRDFTKIKEAASRAEPVDNSEKIAKLRSQIETGTYEIDYDKLADKLLMQEFN